MQQVDWSRIHAFNRGAAGKHLTATKKWAAKIAKENPPQSFIAVIDPSAEKRYGMKRSGQDVITQLQKLGVDPMDIEAKT